MIKKITQQDFQNTVLDSKVPVLVDFWAEWCGPCRMIAPTLEKLATELGSGAIVCKVNVDEEKELASKYEITSIPTLLVFKNGQMVERRSGVMNINQLKQLIGV